MSTHLWSTLTQWLEQGVSCALATVVKAEGSVPRQPGAKMLVRADGLSVGTVGGGALEHEVIETAKSIISSGVPKLLSYRLKPDLNMSCGGLAEVFVEPLIAPDRLYIFGAGHVGQALCPVAAQLGLAVTVVDDRTELLCAERFPHALAFVYGFSPDQWDRLIFDDKTYCVVTTHNHAMDTDVVRELLKRPVCYVGMIGSKSKKQTVVKTLQESGIAVQRIGELHSPIGLSIGAETPEEIAISIAAELVQVRRMNRRGSSAPSETKE